MEQLELLVIRLRPLPELSPRQEWRQSLCGATQSAPVFDARSYSAGSDAASGRLGILPRVDHLLIDGLTIDTNSHTSPAGVKDFV